MRGHPAIDLLLLGIRFFNLSIRSPPLGPGWRGFNLVPTLLVADIEGTEGIWCHTPPSLPESLKTVIIKIHPQIIGPAAAVATVQALVDEGFRIEAVSGTVMAFARR